MLIFKTFFLAFFVLYVTTTASSAQGDDVILKNVKGIKSILNSISDEKDPVVRKKGIRTAFTDYVQVVEPWLKKKDFKASQIIQREFRTAAAYAGIATKQINFKLSLKKIRDKLDEAMKNE